MEPAALSPGFVGRTVERRQLRWLLTQAESGYGRFALIAGEAGIGKTRLCEEAAAAAASDGMRLAWAACRESAGQPAFAPWRDVCDQLEIDLGDRPADDAPELARWQRFVDVAEALRRVASVRPLLVVMDDVQWADPVTLHLLAHLAPVLRTTSAVVLATVRSPRFLGDAATDALLAETERHATVLRLEGLRAEELEVLVRELTGSASPPSLTAQLHGVTGGNPLFAGEIVRRLHAGGSLNALAGGGHVPVPPTARAALDQQLAELGEPERLLVGVAAVIGHEFPVDLLADVAGLDRREVLVGLDAALRARVVTPATAGRYTFSHPLLRNALRDDLGAAERLRLHEQVGEALESAARRGHDVDVEVLSFHFLNAGPTGDTGKAVRYTKQAAVRAMASFAYERAAELYAHALAAQEWDSDSADRAGLLLGLGRARRAAGDVTGARGALFTAADLARRDSRPDVLAAVALALSGNGFEVALFDADQIALLEEALTGLGEEEPSLRSRLAARLSVALSLSGQEQRRVRLSEEAVALARRSDGDAALASALAAWCDAASGPAEVERRIEESARITAIARRRGDRETELLGRRLRVVALLEAGDVFGADAEVAAFGRLADSLHQPGYRWYVRLWRGLRAAMQGEMAEQEALAAEAEDLGRRGCSVNSDLLVTAQRWFCRMEVGEVDAAITLFGSSGIVDSHSELGVQIVPTVALHWLAAGRSEEAGALLDRSTDELRAAPQDSEWVPMLVQVADACARLGGHELAPWVYASLRPFANRWAVEGIGAYTHGSVGRHLGQLAALLGHRDHAQDHFDAALAANRRAGAPLLVARTLLERGIALDDMAALEEAAGCYEELGIQPRVAEVRLLLDRRDTGPAAAAPSHPAAHVFRRDGDVWRIVFGDRSASLRDSKGIRDLARLLTEPGREIPALDLASDSAASRGAVAAELDGLEGDLGEVLDARARTAYKARLVELDAELAEADAASDGERSARAAAERDALLQQLAGAYGLAGRPRRTGAPAERARTAVTARIRDAIRRIEAVHPDLGRHLARSVRTGTLCSYDPEVRPRWEV